MKIVHTPTLITSCQECPFFGSVSYGYKKPLYVCTNQNDSLPVIANPKEILVSCKLEDAPELVKNNSENSDTESVRNVLEQAKETVTEFFNVCDKVSEDIHANEQKPQLDVEKKRKQRHDVEWTHPEIDLIAQAKSLPLQEAVELYNEKYPDTGRTWSSIRNMYYKLRKEARRSQALETPAEVPQNTEIPQVCVGSRVKVTKGILFGKTCKIIKCLFDEEKQEWSFRVTTDGPGPITTAWVYSKDFEVLTA